MCFTAENVSTNQSCDEVRVHSNCDHLSIHQGNGNCVVANEEPTLTSELVQLVDNCFHGEVVADSPLLASSRNDACRPHNRKPAKISLIFN